MQASKTSFLLEAITPRREGKKFWIRCSTRIWIVSISAFIGMVSCNISLFQISPFQKNNFFWVRLIQENIFDFLKTVFIQSKIDVGANQEKDFIRLEGSFFIARLKKVLFFWRRQKYSNFLFETSTQSGSERMSALATHPIPDYSSNPSVYDFCSFIICEKCSG